MRAVWRVVPLYPVVSFALGYRLRCSESNQQARRRFAAFPFLLCSISPLVSPPRCASVYGYLPVDDDMFDEDAEAFSDDGTLMPTEDAR